MGFRYWYTEFMAYLELSHGMKATIDDEDFEFLSQWRWSRLYNKKRGTCYVVRKEPKSGKNRRLIQLHRVIVRASKGQIVDHVNHDTLDNRRQNLRIVTWSQNACNRKRKVNSTSGFKGVTLRPHLGKKSGRSWEARISLNGKIKSLGVFRTAEEAHEVYNIAAAGLHGEFACSGR